MNEIRKFSFRIEQAIIDDGKIISNNLVPFKTEKFTKLLDTIEQKTNKFHLLSSSDWKAY